MPADRETGQYRPPDIDRLIHEPARYNIMALLFVIEKAEFLFVQNQTGMTSGNLSTHLAKLESAGYVDIEKKFVSRKPKTFVRLNRNGRRAFEEYRKQMQALLSDPPRIHKGDDIG